MNTNGIKISEMPQKNVLEGNEFIPIIDNEGNKKISADLLKGSDSSAYIVEGNYLMQLTRKSNSEQVSQAMGGVEGFSNILNAIKSGKNVIFSPSNLNGTVNVHITPILVLDNGEYRVLICMLLVEDTYGSDLNGIYQIGLDASGADLVFSIHEVYRFGN